MGGCATTFKRSGRMIECALHEMELGDAKHDGKVKLFNDLEVFKHIEFSQPNRRCDVLLNGKTYSLPQGEGNAEAYLI